jgi:hypothetical protein
MLPYFKVVSHLMSRWVLQLKLKSLTIFFIITLIVLDDYEHQPLYSRSIQYILQANTTDADRYFTISNNNWYTDPVFGEIIDEYGADDLVRYEEWDTEEQNPIPFKYVARTDFFANQTMLDTSTIIPPPVLINFINNGQADTTNNFKESLIFDNPPPVKSGLLDFFC